MVRKVGAFVALLALIMAMPLSASASTSYEVYEGNPSNTYITYYRDILAGVGFNEHYVAFRSGQYEYTMLVGELVYNNGYFSCTDAVTAYVFTSNSSYNSYYAYNVTSIDDFTLNPGDKIIYSDLGNFPQLEERSARYEQIEVLLLVTFGMCACIRSIFNSTRKR